MQAQALEALLAKAQLPLVGTLRMLVTLALPYSLACVSPSIADACAALCAGSACDWQLLWSRERHRPEKLSTISRLYQPDGILLGISWPVESPKNGKNDFK